MIGLVDSHAHLMDRAFADDLTAVLERARAAAVEALVLVGYDLDSSRAAIRLANSIPSAVATVGIHPNAARSASDADLDAIAHLAGDAPVGAIGETGLDYFRDRTPPARQREAFEWHLQLAERLHLPVVVHTRDAHADVAYFLERSAARRAASEIPGVLHCFTGSTGFASRMLDAGYYLSFAGPLTYKNAADVRDVARSAPSDRLLVETDCPYLPPASRRGQRNEPAYVAETASYLAELRHESLPELLARLWDNSVRVFPALSGVAQVV
ncbi:MAG TPA: TatD family hydrolase, partial [Chloroflexota bacterium]|nr:TatD family hydrolase [Chloroflexota bacterium]